jgi:hypothetical protein
MSGLFAHYQPAYADLGITLLPCSTDAKKPLVRNPFKMGIPASNHLAGRFTEVNALGFGSGRRNRITVLDVDVAGKEGERVLADAIARHGEPRVIVRTASGKFHGYYRYAGERRMIRPWPEHEIDVLGNTGIVYAAPSLYSTGQYQIIAGTLEDLRELTPMRGVDDLKQPRRDNAEQTPAESLAEPAIKKGARNNWLWRECMKNARNRNTRDDLLDLARTLNERCTPPMEEAEIMTIAMSAWTYTEQGRNSFGQFGAWFAIEEIGSMLHDQDAFFLLAFLRANNGPLATFMVANGLSETFQWRRERFAAARKRLIELGYIIQVQKPHQGSAARYRWD